jgi:phenylacetate-CoA ligase
LDFNPELSWEKWTPDDIEARSLRALRNHVRHVIETSPYYHDTLSAIDPEDIQSYDAISILPFTEKPALVDHADKFLAVPEAQVVETVVTSGSTGKPLLFRLTRNDLDRLSYNEALSFSACGVTADDRVQLLVSLDRLFIAGMAYYRGCTLLGANTMRVGVMPADMQKHFMETMKPSVLVGVPSFLRKLGADMRNHGYDFSKSSVKKLVCIGESIRCQDMTLNPVGQALEALYQARAYSTYASTELSTAYCECTAQAGGHSHPELVYTEIVDDAGKHVADGSVGELVVTPLGVEGMPLVRYRTGDLTFKIPQPCSCGRNSCRIGPILARKSQMIKLKGTTVYPLTITNALDELDFVQDYLITLEGDESLSDQVAVHAVAPASSVEKIASHLRTRARVSFPVLITNAPTINALRGGEGRKKTRILDKRNQKKR